MSEQSNKVTVVTVCRNCARMLEKTIKALRHYRIPI